MSQPTTRSAWLLVALLALLTAPTLASDWTKFGGPNGDFSVSGTQIARSWPESGPRELWRIEFGEHGHSGVLVEDDTLYAFVRRGEQDVLGAFDVKTGSKRWETAYDSPLPEGYNNQFGPGPHATPLIVGDRIFTVSSTHVYKAFAKSDGKELWSVGLKDELSVRQMGRGYGASPTAWGDLVIAVGGGAGQGVVAFKQETGEIAWTALDGGGYSSPLILTIDEVEQVVVALGPLRAGLDPASGEVLWQAEMPETASTTMATQLLADDHLLFASSAYADGSRILEVRKDGDEWKTEVLWYTRKLRLQHGTAVRAGGLVLASSGDFGPAFLAAVDIESGDVAFRQRGFAKANLVKVGDLFLVLDEDGKFGLLELGADGFDVLAEQDGVLSGVTWTAPTVVESTAYLRSRTEIVALDLGSAGGAGAGR